MREVLLPSGSILKVSPAPFADAKNLYQALLKELKEVQIDLNAQAVNLYKELFCIGFSSPVIETYLWKCMERCSYNRGQGDMKIDKDTFESLDARQDFVVVCIEVAKDNVDPFAKSLFAEYKRMSQTVASTQE